MTNTYEVIINEYSGNESVKRTDEDGKEWFIPKDIDNYDYKEYLNWLEENNV
jgi:hypothetical protein